MTIFFFFLEVVGPQGKKPMRHTFVSKLTEVPGSIGVQRTRHSWTVGTRSIILTGSVGVSPTKKPWEVATT